MFLVKKQWLLAILILTILMVLTLGIYYYLALSKVDSAAESTVKLLSENFIYISIIFIAVLIGLSIALFAKSNDVLKELDKIAELSRKELAVPRESFKRLGALGEKIMVINAGISKLNEIKSKKISSMGKINNFIFNIIDLPVFITDVNGQITKVSKGLLEYLDIERKYILDNNVDNILDDFNFSALAQELRRSQHVPIKREIQVKPDITAHEEYFVFYPIFNYQNELANSICLLVEEALYEKLASKTPTESLQSKEAHVSPLLKRLLDLFNAPKE